MQAAAQVLATRSENQWVHMMELWLLYDQAGETGRALEWMEKAHESRAPDLLYLGALWFSDELRANPGYQELLRRVNLQDLATDRG